MNNTLRCYCRQCEHSSSITPHNRTAGDRLRRFKGIQSITRDNLRSECFVKVRVSVNTCKQTKQVPVLHLFHTSLVSFFRSATNMFFFYCSSWGRGGKDVTDCLVSLYTSAEQLSVTKHRRDRLTENRSDASSRGKVLGLQHRLCHGGPYLIWLK